MVISVVMIFICLHNSYHNVTINRYYQYDSVKRIDESNLHNSIVIMYTHSHTLDGYFSFGFLIHWSNIFKNIKHINWLVSSFLFSLAMLSLDLGLLTTKITAKDIIPYKIVFYDGWHGGWHSKSNNIYKYTQQIAYIKIW